MNRPGRCTLLLAMALLALPLPAAAVVTTFDVTAPSEAVPEVTLQIFDADEPETVVEERKVESEGTVEVELDADRSYLTAGGVFTDDMIDAYITLKQEEIETLNSTTHPVEFAMYYSV